MCSVRASSAAIACTGFEDLLERLDDVEATPTAGFAKPPRSDP
jgi:hypothetical protein